LLKFNGIRNEILVSLQSPSQKLYPLKFTILTEEKETAFLLARYNSKIVKSIAFSASEQVVFSLQVWG